MATIPGVKHVLSMITIQGIMCVQFCGMIPLFKPESVQHTFQDHRKDIPSVFIPYTFAQNHYSHNEFEVEDYTNKELTRFKRRLNSRYPAMSGRRVPMHFSTIIQSDEVGFPDEISDTNPQEPVKAVCEDNCECVILDTTLKCTKPNTLTRIPTLKDAKLARNITVM